MSKSQCYLFNFLYSLPSPCYEGETESTEKISEFNAYEDENIPEACFGPQRSSHRNSLIQTLAQMDNRILVRFVSEQVLF